MINLSSRNRIKRIIISVALVCAIVLNLICPSFAMDNVSEAGFIGFEKLASAAGGLLTKIWNDFKPIEVQAAIVAPDDAIASGTSGTCTWYISADGELVIGPTKGDEGTLEGLSGYYDGAPWYSNKASITSARFEGTVHGGSNCSFMFGYCSNMVGLDVTGFDTSSVTDMGCMFYNCSSLTNLDVTNFDTSKVTSMSSMFSGCRSLTSLDLLNFDTSKVTHMDDMFSYCISLTGLNVSGFDTSSVESMGSMFYACNSLAGLDVSGFDTSSVTGMYGMFEGCINLTSLDVSSFDTSSVKSMSSMFEGCSSLTSLDLSNFDTSNVTGMSSMFEGCNKLTTLDVSNFNTSSVTDMSSMFEDCSNLISLDLSNFDTSKVMYMDYMFWDCNSLTSLDVSNFDTSSATDMIYMFYNCSSLTSLDLSQFDTSSVTSMGSMFYECSSLTSLDLTNFDTSSVTHMYNMFSGCKKLSKIKLGTTFSFKGKNITPTYNQAYPPTPSPTGTKDGTYTGKWTKETPYNHTDAITAATLRDTYDGATMAGTWYWEKNGSDSETTVIQGKDLTHYTSGYGSSFESMSNDEVVRAACQDLVTAIDEYMDSLNKSVKTEANTEANVTNLRDYDQKRTERVLTCVCKNESAWTAAYAGLAEFYDRFEKDPPNESIGEINVSASLTSIEAQITKAIRGSIKVYNFYVPTTDFNVSVSITAAFSAFTGHINVTRKKRIGGETNSWSFVVVSDVDTNIKTMAKYYKDLCDTTEQVVKDGLKSYLKTVGNVSGITQIAKEQFTDAIGQIVDHMRNKGYGNILKYCAFLYDGYQISTSVSSLTTKSQLSNKLSDAKTLYEQIKALDYSDNSIKDKILNASLKTVEEKKDYLCDVLYNYIYHPDENLNIERGFLEKTWNNFASWFGKGKIVTAQCPVTIEVYDKDNNLLGIAEDGYSESTDDIYIEVNGDVKTIYIPDELDVTIKMIGTNTGDMTYTVERFEQNKPVGRLNYYNVPLMKNGVYTQTISSGDINADVEACPLHDENGSVINANEYISVNDDALCLIGCKLSEGGTVFGQGSYAKGDKVELYAYAKDGYRFDGWYDGDYLLETNNVYRMAALKDTTVEAVFSLIPKEQTIICMDSFKKDISEGSFYLDASSSGNGKLYYFSNDENIATVDDKGKVILKDTGKVDLLIAAERTGEYVETMKTVSLEITNKSLVEKVFPEAPVSNATSISNKEEKSLDKQQIILKGISHNIASGKKIKLSASGLPANALIWTTSNPKVATVTQTGVVTIKKKTGGKSVTITATAADGSGISASWKIKSMKGVVKKIAVTGAKTVKAGKSLKLKAKVTATKGANKKLRWTSSNTKYATVSSTGTAKTLKAGKGKKVKITAMATDGSGKKKTVIIKIK